MSRRREQIESTLHRALEEIVRRGFQDPRIRGLITITRVRVSPDLRNAEVLISVLPKEHQELTLHGLRSASAHIRHRLGDLVRIQRAPSLAFRIDEGLQAQSAVYDALSKLSRERGADDATDLDEPLGEAAANEETEP